MTDVALMTTQDIEKLVRSVIKDLPRPAPLPPPMSYDVVAAAKTIGVSPNLVRQLVRSGELKSCRVNTRIVIPRKAIDEFLDERLSERK